MGQNEFKTDFGHTYGQPTSQYFTDLVKLQLPPLDRTVRLIMLLPGYLTRRLAWNAVPTMQQTSCRLPNSKCGRLVRKPLYTPNIHRLTLAQCTRQTLTGGDIGLTSSFPVMGGNSNNFTLLSLVYKVIFSLNVVFMVLMPYD